MTDPTIPVTEDELHAYVDDELPAERRGDVESWLAAHPVSYTHLDVYKRQFLAGGAAGWVAHGAASPPALLQNVTGEALDALLRPLVHLGRRLEAVLTLSLIHI